MRWAVYASEVELRLHAQTLRELFIEAGHALAEVLAGSSLPRPDGMYELVQLEADNREALLRAWLEELIALGEQDHKVFTSFQIEYVDDGTLVAGVRGAATAAGAGDARVKRTVRCKISEGPDTFTGLVLLDT